MPIRIQIDPNKVGAKVMGAWKESLLPLSAQIMQDCNQYVKIDTHAMELSSGTASDLHNGKSFGIRLTPSGSIGKSKHHLHPAEHGNGAKQPNANSNQTGKSWLINC